MNFWVDVFSSWDNFITLAFVFLLFYGGIWVINQVIEGAGSTRKSSRIRKTEYRNELKKPTDPIITKVVGVTFDDRQDVISNIRVGEFLELVPEPENQYDENAIKVVKKSGEQIGYLSRSIAKETQWFFTVSLLSRRAKVMKIVGDKSKDHSLGIIIEIYPPTLEETLLSSEIMYPRY